ncbi:hypothetical protein B0T11DRAFT_48724 [Plectosphaerella cucumerina]|uniref:Uncharacterized protein n=1 Tax=Plectosphaerella cucumerina TaxID=40658 RepID=A0A8K0TG16_9PEZI|nr:hypothetical protein B0T11DRAFT_48724 [Plectosphaerella cucumerina]
MLLGRLQLPHLSASVPGGGAPGSPGQVANGVLLWRVFAVLRIPTSHLPCGLRPGTWRHWIAHHLRHPAVCPPSFQSHHGISWLDSAEVRRPIKRVSPGIMLLVPAPAAPVLLLVFFACSASNCHDCIDPFDHHQLHFFPSVPPPRNDGTIQWTWMNGGPELPFLNAPGLRSARLNFPVRHKLQHIRLPLPSAVYILSPPSFTSALSYPVHRLHCQSTSRRRQLQSPTQKSSAVRTRSPYIRFRENLHLSRPSHPTLAHPLHHIT